MVPWCSQGFPCVVMTGAGGEGREIPGVGHFPGELPWWGQAIPGVIDPAVNSHWQEGVEVEPDGEIVLRFAVAHPVHHVRLVQLCFQLVPETAGHWWHHRGRAEPATDPIPPALGGCPAQRFPWTPKQGSPGAARTPRTLGDPLERHPQRTACSTQEQGCSELKCGVSVEAALKTHPQGPPELPFPRGDTPSCHPRPKPANPYQHKISQVIAPCLAGFPSPSPRCSPGEGVGAARGCPALPHPLAAWGCTKSPGM